MPEDSAAAASSSSEHPHALVFAAASARLKKAADDAANDTRTPAGWLSELELLRRAYYSALDQRDAAEKQRHERAERERLRNEPSEEKKEELKWTLFEACWQGDPDRVSKILSQKGSDPNVRQTFGVTPLHRVARLGNAQLVETLLKHGAKVDATDDEGRLASHYAEERLPLVQGDEKSSALLTATLTVLRQWEEKVGLGAPSAASAPSPSKRDTSPTKR